MAAVTTRNLVASSAVADAAVVLPVFNEAPNAVRFTEAVVGVVSSSRNATRAVKSVTARVEDTSVVGNWI
jgi:hypothetical protein